jgi:hypothetical protein
VNDADAAKLVAHTLTVDELRAAAVDVHERIEGLPFDLAHNCALLASGITGLRVMGLAEPEISRLLGFVRRTTVPP